MRAVGWFPLIVSLARGLPHYLPLSQQKHHDLSLPPSTRRNRQTQAEDDGIDGLYQGYGTHYADLAVGCPPQIQTVIIDTGSSHTGFPCSGCDPTTCGQSYHLNPFFQQQESTCFSSVPCSACEIGSASCLDDVCSVNVLYAEGSSWAGVEVEDLVSAGGLDDERFPIRFACQSSVTGLFKTQLADGILGLSKRDGSFWKQLDSQGQLDKKEFSLCYNLQEEAETPAGVMVLGGSDSRLHETPMVFAADVRPTSRHFTVRVKEMQLRVRGGFSVNVAGDNSNMTNLILAAEQTPIIDSGTTCTYLNRNLRTPFEQAWNQLTDYPAFANLGIFDDELDDLPTVIFQLEGALGEEDIFVAYPPTRYLRRVSQDSYRFCFFMTEFGDGVLGANLMAGHDVLHDIENTRIGFAQSSCDYSTVNTTRLPVSPARPTASPVPVSPTPAGSVAPSPPGSRITNIGLPLLGLWFFL